MLHKCAVVHSNLVVYFLYILPNIIIKSHTRENWTPQKQPCLPHSEPTGPLAMGTSSGISVFSLS